MRAYHHTPRKARDSTHLEEIIVFHSPASLPVIVEPLEMHHQHRRQRLDAHPLQRVPLLPTLLTEVGIVSLQPVPLHKLLQGLRQSLGLDGQRQREERLLPIVGVVTASTDLLVQKRTSKYLLEDLWARLFLMSEREIIIMLYCTTFPPSLRYLELLVNLIRQVTEEVKRILLLPNIHWLSPQLEFLPEALRGIVLQLALQ